MSESVRNLIAPKIVLVGTRIMDDGTYKVEDKLNWSNTPTSGTPSEVSNPGVVTFKGNVRITMSAQYDLYEYAHTEDDTQKNGLQDGTLKGNILYSLSEKLPSPSDCEIYTGPFYLVAPGNDPRYLGTAHTVDSQMIAITAAVFFQGQVSKETLVYIRVVND